MNNYYAAFVHGADKFPLDGTHELFLAQDYTPPGVNVLASFASGTLRNRMSGGEVTSKQHIDRDLSIPILTKGKSQYDTHGVIRNLESFIERCLADDSEKLYFEFGASDAVPYTPKWGQQFYKYEVKLNSGAFIDRNLYGVASIREKFVPWIIPLTVGPFATGLRQRVGSATGGILEHSYATADGLSRGLHVPPAVTNLITNPVFGHGTYDNDWTAGAGLIAAENTDKKFVLFGSSSVKLTAIAAANTDYYQTHTAAGTNPSSFSVYAKLEDGSAVSATQISLRYAGATLSTTYTPEGDGWYRLTATANGVASPQRVAVVLADTGYTVYIDGYQFVYTASFVRDLAYGDQLDTAWSGTAHDSSSTRTLARWRIDATEILNIASGSMRVVWRAPFANTGFAGTTGFLFSNGGSSFQGWFSGASNVWAFGDGTNQVTGADTFSVGDIKIFHFIWDTDRLEIYLNGAELVGGATYTPPTLAADLYLGTNATPTNHIDGLFLSEPTTWNEALTAAEVLADYNNVTEHVNGGDTYGQQLNPIPWLWTDDGDDEVDNCYDDDYQHFCVIDGIPGNVDALTEAIFTSSASTQDDLQTGTLYVNQVRSDVYRDPNNWCFQDLSGVANGAYCGGAYQQSSIGTAFTDISNKNISGDNSRWLQDMKLRSILVRLADASGDDFEMRVRYQLDTSTIILFNEGKANTATTANKMFGTQNFMMPEYYTLDGVQSDHNLYVGPQIKRISGTANMNFDFYHLAFDRLAKIDQRLEKNDATTKTHYSSELKKATDYYGSGNLIGGFPILADSSDVIELTPNVLNNLFFFMLYVTYTHYVEIPGPVSTAIEMYVTPRWSLL